ISRSEIFKMAWKAAKGTAAGYRTLRAAFAAALRRVWSLVKAAAAEEARRPVRPAQPAKTWASENPYRAAAVASRKARLGTYSHPCW
ncbi:MAG TPA: hypothetical protein VK196_18640, partial [Magnetospirillum sp.]|nr:hypothetical protein [Magnetospirillum sp.]